MPLLWPDHTTIQPMKTLHTLALIIFGTGTLTAQTPRFAAHHPAAEESTGVPATGAHRETKPAHTKPTVQGHAKAGTTILGGAGNVYTILLGSQNQVSYDPDINTVIFGHRQDPAGFAGQGGTGTMRFDVSTDGGTTWTLNHLLTPNLFDGSADTIIGARYPSTALYNPPGNTDPANAYAASTGMALNTLDTTLGFNNTGYLQRSSAKLDGSNATGTFTDFYGDRTTYNTYGLCSKSDGTLWALSSRQSNSLQNADTITFKAFEVNKGVWNVGTQQVDWSSVATLTPQTVVYNDPAGTDNKFVQVNTWNMGFAPDGLVGYCVVLGKEYDAIRTGPMPLVWKTIDGGDTWNQLPNHDFGAEQWMIDNIMPANDNGETRPYFADMDLTVDVNGTLHIAAEVLSQYYGSSPDSVNYIFTALASRFILHVATSDGITWAIDKLSDKFGTDYEYPVLNLTTGPLQGDRPQASRTADGTHVFFTWNRSGDSDAQNSFPEIHGMAYNAGTAQWTAEKSLSGGTQADGGAWWHTVSPICISNGADFDYELPTVYADPGGNADEASGFIYLKGIGFNEDEFVVGIAEARTAAAVNVYPNPSEGIVHVQLKNGASADVLVTDITGRAVRTMHTVSDAFTLDLRTEGAGIYTLIVLSAQGRITRKVVVR